MKKVKAIFVSDLHLQARAPVARAGEPDWFAAMKRPLDEIQSIVDDNDGNVAVLYAGDIFDRWSAGPEVINFALNNLPRGWAVPGQHDLPNHSYADIHRSAYWTLVEAGHIVNLEAGVETVVNGGCVATGFPWGHKPTPLRPDKKSDCPNIAVIHSFIWMKGLGYPGAPEGCLVGGYRKALKGYDVAIFGDNHKGFISQEKGGQWVVNCGGMMRRKIDEREYRPGIGLLLEDGSVVRHYFDTSEEVFAVRSEAEEIVDEVLDMSAFVDSLKSLEDNDELDFRSAMRRFINDNDVEKPVADILLAATEGE